MAKQKEPEAPASVTVRPLREISWPDSPGGRPRGYAANRPVVVPRALAVLWIVLEAAEPEGWTPTPEDVQGAAPAVFRELEGQRKNRGLSEADALRIPALRRRYEALAAAFDDDGPSAA